MTPGFSRWKFSVMFGGWLMVLGISLGLSPWSAAAERELVRREWTVEAVTREGLLAIPASAPSVPMPVLFAFHGHGGTMRQASRSFDYHTLWPEALVVYLQGLNTPGQLTDPEGKRPGWQSNRGDQRDRDLKFFDVVLAELRREYRVDARRIYAAGHSNGGGFTYLLWAERGDLFAAMAPSGALSRSALAELKPKPMIHVAGEADPLVKFAWQQQMYRTVLKLNDCAAGTPWEHGGTYYASKTGAPVVIWTHPGGHEFPAKARTAIVAFLKLQSRPESKP